MAHKNPTSPKPVTSPAVRKIEDKVVLAQILKLIATDDGLIEQFAEALDFDVEDFGRFLDNVKIR